MVDFTEEPITQLGDPRTLSDMSKVRIIFVQILRVKFVSKLLSDKPTIAKLKEWSIHPEPNGLFLVPGLDVFKTPSCMLHALDHGVFVRLLDMVCALVSQSSPAIQHDFEGRYTLVRILTLI